MYIEPKLDWSASDFFNFHDMNRIENNIQAVVNRIYEQHDKEIVLETISKNRTINSFDYIEDINRMERNLEKIRKNWIEGNTYMRKGGKQWDINTPFTYEDAVRWEYNLFVLYTYADMEFRSYFKYVCGTFNCGEEVI